MSSIKSTGPSIPQEPSDAVVQLKKLEETKEKMYADPKDPGKTRYKYVVLRDTSSSYSTEGYNWWLPAVFSAFFFGGKRMGGFEAEKHIEGEKYELPEKIIMNMREESDLNKLSSLIEQAKKLRALLYTKDPKSEAAASLEAPIVDHSRRADFLNEIQKLDLKNPDLKNIYLIEQLAKYLPLIVSLGSAASTTHATTIIEYAKKLAALNLSKDQYEALITTAKSLKSVVSNQSDDLASELIKRNEPNLTNIADIKTLKERTEDYLKILQQFPKDKGWIKATTASQKRVAEALQKLKEPINKDKEQATKDLIFQENREAQADKRLAELSTSYPDSKLPEMPISKISDKIQQLKDAQKSDIPTFNNTKLEELQEPLRARKFSRAYGEAFIKTFGSKEEPTLLRRQWASKDSPSLERFEKLEHSIESGNLAGIEEFIALMEKQTDTLGRSYLSAYFQNVNPKETDTNKLRANFIQLANNQKQDMRRALGDDWIDKQQTELSRETATLETAIKEAEDKLQQSREELRKQQEIQAKLNPKSARAQLLPKNLQELKPEGLLNAMLNFSVIKLHSKTLGKVDIQNPDSVRKYKEELKKLKDTTYREQTAKKAEIDTVVNILDVLSLDKRAELQPTYLEAAEANLIKSETHKKELEEKLAALKVDHSVTIMSHALAEIDKQITEGTAIMTAQKGLAELSKEELSKKSGQLENTYLQKVYAEALRKRELSDWETILVAKQTKIDAGAKIVPLQGQLLGLNEQIKEIDTLINKVKPPSP